MTGLDKFLLLGSFGLMGLGAWGSHSGWDVTSDGIRDVYQSYVRHTGSSYYGAGRSTRVGSRRHGRTYHTGGKHW